MDLRNIIVTLLLMLAIVSCKKPVEVTQPDVQVPILLSASTTDLTTKAYLDRWDDTKVNIFGLKSKAAGYDYDDPSNIVDKEAVISSDNKVSLYSDNQSKSPYY